MRRNAFAASQQVAAPRTGAWIEISEPITTTDGFLAAPRTGAWIEIIGIGAVIGIWLAAPRTGAWIEIVFLM